MTELSREPQEQAEDFENAHEHGGKEHTTAKRARWPALVMAVMCVLGAICASRSGHSEIEAMLTQIESSGKWNYYQAVSTKDHMMESTDLILDSLAATDPGAIAKIHEGKVSIEKSRAKYEHQKEETQTEARTLEKQVKHELFKHHEYARAVETIQIGMVLVTISIVMAANMWAFGGIAFGVFGLLFAFVAEFGAFWEGTMFEAFVRPIATLVGIY